MRAATATCLLGLSLAGCFGGPEGGQKDIEPADAVDAANALTRGLRFDGGERAPGALPTDIDGSVELFAPSMLLRFAPGDVASLAFELSDPTDEFPEWILIRFDDATEHLVVPTAGTPGLGTQLVGGLYTLDGAVCAKLCEQVYAFDMSLTVSFATDRVAPAVVRPVALDCRGAGDPAYCPAGHTPEQPAAGTGGNSGFGGTGGFPGTGAFGGTG